MGKITFVLGGARSGKSNFAKRLAEEQKNGRVVFLATSQALDQEMARRIKKHKQSRPAHWLTLEEPLDLSAALRKQKNRFTFIIIDCLTLWVSNMILAGYSERSVILAAGKALDVLKKNKAQAVIVANEVGLGIVPNNKLARDFRDIAGKVNQLVARHAQEVYFIIAGVTTKIKG